MTSALWCERHTQREAAHVKIKAEIGEAWLQAKYVQEWLATSSR